MYIYVYTSRAQNSCLSKYLSHVAVLDRVYVDTTCTAHNNIACMLSKR